MLALFGKLYKSIVPFLVCLLLSLAVLILPSGTGATALADPGSGWEVLEVEFALGISSIDAVDASTAWASGSDTYGSPDGLICRTTDGGESWISQGPELPGVFYDISAVDENTAWTIHTDPSTGTYSILKTGDGGANWTVQKQDSPGYMFMGISALNADVALAVGNKIIAENVWQWRFCGVALLTVDGGATWSTLLERDRHTFMDVAVVDATTAWIIGDEVLKTSDGGMNWENQYSVSYVGSSAKIAALDANNAWFACMGLVCKTTDGGENWQSCAPEEGNTYNGVSVLDANTAWVAGGSTYAPYDPDMSAVYRTQDGGATWEKIMPGQAIYPAVCAADAETVWVSGVMALQKTTDGGDTWEMQGLSGVDCDFLSVGALGQDFAVIGGVDSTGSFALPGLGSIIAGNFPVFGGQEVFDIWEVSLHSDMESFFTGFDAWMVGSGGTVVRLLKDTSSQDPFPDPGVDNDLYDISALDMQTAWVAGDGILLKTGDG
ncbi:MAG: hypothetical protein JW854_05605, partial [Actinobacteria bacterium]|nr:hypothetical protein [Actinomycetota bacterium]